MSNLDYPLSLINSAYSNFAIEYLHEFQTKVENISKHGSGTSGMLNDEKTRG
jgi:hypothetical protein